MNANLGFTGMNGLPFEIMKDKNRTRKMVFYGRVSTEHGLMVLSAMIRLIMALLKK